MSRSFIRRVLAGTALCLAAMAATQTAAWAHVSAVPAAADGGLTRVEFSFTHGCGNSPTTGMRIQLPAGTTGVTPEDPAGWTSTVTPTELGWTGGPATNGNKTTFAATMKLVGTQGDTVFFPTIQLCPTDENPWIDKSDDPEAENAAPRIRLVVTASGGAENGAVEPTTTVLATSTTPTSASAGTTTATAATTKPVTTDPPSSPSSTSNVPLIVAGVVVVIAILAAGGFMLSKRGSSGP